MMSSKYYYNKIYFYVIFYDSFRSYSSQVNSIFTQIKIFQQVGNSRAYFIEPLDLI